MLQSVLSNSREHFAHGERCHVVQLLTTAEHVSSGVKTLRSAVTTYAGDGKQHDSGTEYESDDTAGVMIQRDDA